MHFKRHFAFQNAKIIYIFPENLKKNLGFTRKFMYSWVTTNTGLVLFGLVKGNKAGHFM